MEDFGDTVPNADVCFFFLKEPPTKQQTVRSDEGRMPERQGHKPGEVSKIHCCLCPSGLGAWAQVESSHLAPGGHGPLSPPPVVTLAELVIFSQPQAILVSALFLPAPEPLWCCYWFSRKPPEEGGGRVGLGISLLLSVSGSEIGGGRKDETLYHFREPLSLAGKDSHLPP